MSDLYFHWIADVHFAGLTSQQANSPSFHPGIGFDTWDGGNGPVKFGRKHMYPDDVVLETLRQRLPGFENPVTGRSDEVRHAELVRHLKNDTQSRQLRVHDSECLARMDTDRRIGIPTRADRSSCFRLSQGLCGLVVLA